MFGFEDGGMIRGSGEDFTFPRLWYRICTLVTC